MVWWGVSSSAIYLSVFKTKITDTNTTVADSKFLW